MGIGSSLGKTLGIDIGAKLGTSKYGPEIVANFDFLNGGAGWNVIGATSDFTGGIATITGNASGDRLTQLVNTEIGANYKVFIRVNPSVQDLVRINITQKGIDGNVTAINYYFPLADWNIYEFDIACVRETFDIWVRVDTHEVLIDYISIRKVL